QFFRRLFEKIVGIKHEGRRHKADLTSLNVSTIYRLSQRKLESIARQLIPKVPDLQRLACPINPCR
ncbi:MAG: hypothetical protein NZ653_08375, partial [Anaerolineae bacterium]|nr:hypothetical protein [Anaerolineae bacterium]